METFMGKDKKKEVDDVLDFISQLSDEEKKYFKSFMDGVKFAKKNEEHKSA